MAKTDDNAAPDRPTFSWESPGQGQVLDEAQPEQVPARSGPYAAGRHFVIGPRGQKVCACYAAENMTAAEVATMVAKAMNK